MNFMVKQYDPIDEAIELFAKFNQTPDEERMHTEAELTQLVVHRIKQHTS